MSNDIELVAALFGPMPTGITVSKTGRIFINFPKWGDQVTFTVAELVDGKPVPYPSAEINAEDGAPLDKRLVSGQSVVVDPKDRLWILDTGRPLFEAPQTFGPKLVGVDLKTNTVFKTITFPEQVVLPTTYLNDVRFDLRQGTEGFAFITDSSSDGPGGIIVVDLATGESWRRLHDHPSTRPDQSFVPIVEGQMVMLRPTVGQPSPLRGASDGIAIGHDGQRLFYCPLTSRNLYSVSVDALVNRTFSDEQVAATVSDHGEKGASDGLESDSRDRVYITDYEHNAIRRRNPDGSFELIVHDPRVLWPDTLSLAQDGYLYFTANQLHRQPDFHRGKDLREKPYSIWRTRIDVQPVLLKG
ncbi:MAG: L-dopachrome tautomerase-related protein [Xenococcaceae cyanobacterium]